MKNLIEIHRPDGCFAQNESGFTWYIPNRNVVFLNFALGEMRVPELPIGKTQKKHFLTSIISDKVMRQDLILKIFRSYKAKISKMLKTEKELNERLEVLEKKWAASQSETEELKKQNNIFRSIGWADNPESYDENVDIFVATHQTSWHDWSIESRIRALNYHQKMTQFFAVSLQKDRSKTEIEVRIKEIRADETKKATENPASRNKEWLKFDKVLEGIMKTSKCNKAMAISMAGIMGMKTPEGYSV